MKTKKLLNGEPHTFGIRFLGSTETPQSGTYEHMLSYAQRCLAANWAPRMPEHFVLSLASIIESERLHNADISDETVRAKHENWGSTFYDSAEAAEAAAQQMVACAVAVLAEVYGDNWRDLLSDSLTMPTREKASA
jgi:hypothetical protein